MIIHGDPLPLRINTEITGFRVLTAELPVGMGFVTVVVHTCPWSREAIRPHDGRWHNATMFEAERVHEGVVRALETRTGPVWQMLAAETLHHREADSILEAATAHLWQPEPTLPAPTWRQRLLAFARRYLWRK